MCKGAEVKFLEPGVCLHLSCPCGVEMFQSGVGPIPSWKPSAMLETAGAALWHSHHCSCCLACTQIFDYSFDSFDIVVCSIPVGLFLPGLPEVFTKARNFALTDSFSDSTHSVLVIKFTYSIAYLEQYKLHPTNKGMRLWHWFISLPAIRSPGTIKSIMLRRKPWVISQLVISVLDYRKSTHRYWNLY